MSECMANWGYSWEPYETTTDDGYILTTFRVTGNLNDPTPRIIDPDLKPLIIMAGYTCDSTCWVTADPAWSDTPTPLALFDSGFDVWMANNRGTKYSQKHTTLNARDDPSYWFWTWQEMGQYDVPANIELVKQQTGVDKVSYVGYSQGTVQMFYSLATLEDSYLGDNLFTFAALAPCTI